MTASLALQFGITLVLLVCAVAVGYFLARQRGVDADVGRTALMTGEMSRLRRRLADAEGRANAAERALSQFKRRMRRGN
ncbi:MAG: hypothetical protein AAFY38_06210 [Pseudomonadota bacterium]